jgi:uncharacterized protein YecE (DUF72 family)
MVSVRIGTSGWSYDHWAGRFYPDSLPAKDRLAFYAGRLGSAEINSTFYRLPAAPVLRRWRDSVPGDFVFAVKASRYITHMKKLNDPAEALGRFLRRIAVLGDTLGPVLFQLPPNWRFDAGRLAAFLTKLRARPGKQRYAFEFRDRSWLNESCYRLLADHGAALCLYHLAGFRSPRIITAGFTYVRLHGPGEAYRGRYDGRTLRGWARLIDRWRADGLDVYCYFDNDAAAHAPGDALRLRGMLGPQSLV